MGRGVFLIKNQDDLARYCEVTTPAYIQEYLKIDRDIRVVVIGEKIAHSYWRIAPHEDFRSNVSVGATISLDPVPQKVLDIALHSSIIKGEENLDKFVSLVDSFLTMPCSATLQVNVIDRDTLLRARANPELPEFRTLIVRVWGFSAVFVDLPDALQDHVLARTEHRM